MSRTERVEVLLRSGNTRCSRLLRMGNDEYEIRTIDLQRSLVLTTMAGAESSEVLRAEVTRQIPGSISS